MKQYGEKTDYQFIIHKKEFQGWDAFCDSEGTINKDLPQTHWKVTFSEGPDSTFVKIELIFGNLVDMEKNLEMGFKEGFTMALGNLDELLDQK